MRLFKMNTMSLAMIALLAQPLSAQDWPQWRGPHRDGHVEEFASPAKWLDSLNLVWKVEAGAGLSSPVVADGKIYLLTRDGDDEIASCYRLNDGSRIWQQRCTTPSSSSPIIASLHGAPQVIVLMRENLAGIAVANGEQLWSYAMESNAQIVTPLVFGDLVIFAAYRSPVTAIRIKKTGASWSAGQVWSTNEIGVMTGVIIS